MLWEVAAPESLLWWLARSHPSFWACAQCFSCINTLFCRPSRCKQSLAPIQAVKPKHSRCHSQQLKPGLP